MSKVFTSRWKALYWSAGVLLLAYCSIPAAEDTQSPDKPDAPKAAPVKPYNKWDPKNRNAPAPVHREPTDRLNQTKAELDRLNAR